MNDRERLRWLVDERDQERTNHLRDKSSSDGSLFSPCTPDPPYYTSNKSCWDYESTTPMTTRPHFTPQSAQRRRRLSPLGVPIRKIRSRSLGAHVDDVEDDWRELVLPNMRATRTTTHQLRTILSDASARGEADNEQLLLQKDDSQHETHDDNNDPDSAAVAKQAETTIEEGNSLYISVLYGMINASIVLPVLMSFSSIIYRDAAFAPYMPVLVKLTVFSGIVHQLCFSTFSSLPFAVGQVQDAGLIFLSSMTAYVVEYCHNRGYDDTILLATVTVSLSLCTALLGLGLILIGRWKLAQYIQMLPTSVVGGYLAFIGWFCGVSGVRLMAGSDQEDLTVGQAAVAQWNFVLPGVLVGLGIYFFVRKIRHMAVLPTCILLLLLIFYIVLWITSTSIAEATEKGWIRAMDEPPPWYRTWNFLRFDKVAWSVLPNLILTELSMIFVVALSSSLDVVAIELELKRPLDYNKELMTVGISNFISGCTGGYTGSYIFSQTIFSLRAGIRSRVAGYVLAAFQFFVVVLPFPLLSYVPNFFFGSLLVMICVDLLYEWLIDVRTRVTVVEYMIDLATFGLIQFLGVEYGILAGVVVYLACYRIGLDVGDVRFAVDQSQSSEEEDEQGDSAETSALVMPSVSKSNETDGAQYGSIDQT